MIQRTASDVLLVLGLFFLFVSVISIGGWAQRGIKKMEGQPEAGARALSMLWHAVGCVGVACAIRFWVW